MKYLSPIRFYEYCGIDLSDINLLSSANVKSMLSEKYDKEYKSYEISYDNNNDPVWGRAGIGIAVLVLIVKVLLIFIL